MQRLARRDQGSALVISVIMIVVTVAMIGMLLAAPQAQLQQVGSAVAKERSLANADAGVRDAVAWLQANKANLALWVVKNSSFYISTTAGTTITADIPTGLAQKTGLTPDPAACNGTSITGQTNMNLILVDDRGTASGAVAGFLSQPGTVSTVINGVTVTKGFPNFVAGNYKPFGDRHTAQNEYAYCIFDEGGNYYRVLAEGRALAAVNNDNKVNIITSRIEAYIYNPIPVVSDPAAVTFLNTSGAAINNIENSNQPGGWVNPDSTTYTAAGTSPAQPIIYTSTSGGGSDKISNTPTGMINGSDQSGLNDPTNGVGIQNNNFLFDNSNSAAASATGTQAVNSNLSSSVTNSIGSLVQTVSGMSSGNGVNVYTYSGNAITVGDSTPTITYLKIPDNTVVDSSIFTFNGSSTYAGVLIVDVGDNVTFTFGTTSSGGSAGLTNTGHNALFNFNGNPNQELGAFIFYQRGSINIPMSGVYLADNQGNATDKLQWNSYDYKTALTSINTPLRISSYRVVQ
jgi:Tfp pilus assembly protein PilX